MERSSIGEFEELVLLTVGVLFDSAYGVRIQEELKDKCNRKVTISTVHAALHRLKEKGFLESRMDGATPERGGRRKLLFRLTKSGSRVLAASRSMRNELWKSIPASALSIDLT